MKKLSFTHGIMLFSMAIILISCKQKEKDGYTTGSEIDTTEVIAMVTPINSKLPSDVLQSCIIDKTDFDSWFKSGNVTKNGIVNPANSVTFGHENNCDFYKWSEQMFLWMASPINDGNYSKGTIMESPVFYTVSPVVDGKRTLIPHTEGQLISVVSNAQKNDPRIDTEEGQATDDVLISQKGSILYYITMVNDVYAQFLTGVKTKKLYGNEFPTTQRTLDSIVNFASSQGVTIQAPETLAIEIKTSWVDASTLSDTSTYITIDAIVPTYTKTDTLWTPKSSETVKLAMVGTHIVGSANGHPEMVWATFEHKNNAPNLAYTYLDTSNQTKTVSADTGNDWLLNSDSASDTYNVSHMTYSKGDIIAKKDTIISASNTKMTKPWGVADTGVPNPENTSVAASNSQVISINNSILGKLTDGDMRKNYIFIGATWTDSGAAPNGQSYSATNTTPGVAIGTNQLANSTMETYFQHGAGFTKSSSCFTCHSGYPTPGLRPVDLSHVYEAIQVLNQGSTK